MNIFRRLILAAVFVFCQTYAHSAAEAATYYVKPTGSDAANGLSEATAWQHVMKACQTLVAGDTVLIRAGTYDETSVVYAMAPPGNIQAGLVPVNSGTPGRHIVFKGYPGDVRPVILGRDTRNGPMRSAVLLAHGEHHITYDSLHFHKGETGIMIRDNPPAYDITLRNLIIDSTYMSADDNNGGVSMYLSGYYGNDPVTGPSQRNILIENCDIFSNGSQFRGSYRASGIHSYSCDSCTIRNNTIHNEVYGINFKYATRFTEVYGNTIYDCDVGYNGTAHAGGSLSYDGPDQVGSIFHHNILYRNNLGIGLTIFGNAGTRYPDSLHYIYNNTIDCSGPYVDPSLYLTGVGIYQRYGHFNRSYYFNNIIYNPVTAARVDAEDTRAAMAHGNESQTPYRFYDDYNMFYSSAGVTNFYMWGTTAYTLSGWRAATPNATITGGADTGDYIGGTVGTHGDHSIVANPLFVNAANRDYRLQSGSPALTSGKGGTFEFYPTYTINLKSGSQRRTLPTYMGALPPADTALSVGDASAIEGDSLRFLVSLSYPTPVAVSYNYATANGTAVTPTNYSARSGTATIGVGESVDTIMVQTIDDGAVNATRTMSVVISAPSRYSIGDGTGLGSILDNDIAVDTTKPVNSAVQATSLTASSATITWTTNEPATSQVNYGLSASYGSSTTLDPAYPTSHSQSLTGLSAGTVYHYRVRSRDAAGNEGVSGDYNFTTTADTVNYALGRAATVSGTYPGYSLVPIADGVIAPRNIATTWASDDTTTVPHWVEIDFGAVRPISAIRVYWAWNSFSSAWMVSQQYRVQRWTGSAYVDVVTVNNSTATDSLTVTTFPTVSMQRARIYQPAGMGPATYPGINWLTELQIWGPASDTIPPAAVKNLSGQQ